MFAFVGHRYDVEGTEEAGFFGRPLALITAAKVENNITINNTLVGIMIDNRFAIGS